jgi:D-alanyl-D-alanine carboxypeptidase (penicillin-binding protein 5/6)
LIDVNTGKVLFAKNEYAHRPPASLTKMAAAIVLLEDGRLTDTVTTPNAVLGTPESSLHLTPGETISLHDLLYAMLLRSANDTPIAGSYYLCGGIAPFVDLMNQKVQSIGCRNTNFVTPNGLYADGHYSCAYDLALIARYGLTHLPTFRQIVKTREYHVTRSIHTGDSLVTNTAMTFLTDFPGADGVKTGYISQAGHCFVGSATRRGWQLVAVALDSSQCRSDVVQLLSYGFAHFRPRRILTRGFAAGIAAVSGRDVSVVTSDDLMDVDKDGDPAPAIGSYHLLISAVPIPPAVRIAEGEKVGTVTLYRLNDAVMSVDALAARTYPALPAGPRLRIGWLGHVARALLIFAVAAIVLPLLFVVGRILELAIHARKIAKNSRRRRAHLAENVGTMDP